MIVWKNVPQETKLVLSRTVYAVSQRSAEGECWPIEDPRLYAEIRGWGGIRSYFVFPPFDHPGIPLGELALWMAGEKTCREGHGRYYICGKQPRNCINPNHVFLMRREQAREMYIARGKGELAVWLKEHGFSDGTCIPKVGTSVLLDTSPVRV